MNYDLQSEDLNWRTHNFTNYELYLNILDGNVNNLINRSTNVKAAMERLKSLYRVYNLILNLRDINKSMSGVRNVLHYDSPTHAADMSMGGVIAQCKAVEELNNRDSLPEFERNISGENNLIIYNLEEKSQNNKKTAGSIKLSDASTEERNANTSRYKMFEYLMGSPLPITQSFYTLGIEKIRKELSPQFAFGRSEIQNLVDRLWKYMDKVGIYRNEDRRKIVTQMFKDWVVYNLSKTRLFGNDGNMTFDQKRQYYLYDFPQEFLEKKSSITEANQIDAIRRLSVRKGKIIMDRGGKTTVSLRDFITGSFDTLLQSNNPELQDLAKKLFMYTYYLNGMDFSYMSFGNMFSTEFQRAFPEFIQALNSMNTDSIVDSDLDNFFEQFIVKRNNMGLVLSETFKSDSLKQEALQRGIYNTEKTVDEYGSWAEVPEFVVFSTVAGKNTTSILAQLSKEESDLYGTIVYLPVKTNTSLHFNANQTLDELVNVVYDQEKINNNSRIGIKKKNSISVGYDAYQSSQNQNEIPVARDANVPEPNEEQPEVTLSSVSDNDDGEINDISMDKAVGISSTEEAEVSYTEYDKAMQDRKIASATQEEAEDEDIKNAQQEIKKNNNGKGLCTIIF